MRAFIAIKLPAQTKDALGRIQNKLKTALPELNWVKPENLHLSLKFLGEINEAQAKEAQKLIALAAKTTGAFEINLNLLGVFPGQPPRVIWAGTNQTPLKLIQLAQAVEKECLKLKTTAEHRPFQAHITLGRIKNPIHQALLQETLQTQQQKISKINLSFKVQGVTLFQSVLSAEGATYNILAEADLLERDSGGDF
jgi:2'-5' RNA ligase